MLRPYNMATRAAPFDSLRVADVGDVAINTFNLLKSIDIIERHFDALLRRRRHPADDGRRPHNRATDLARHAAQTWPGWTDSHRRPFGHQRRYVGEKITHGTPFRRAVEEGLLDTRRVVQIGLRGTGYAADDFDWSRSQGFRVVQAEDCWYKSLAPLMRELAVQVGGGPVYLSVDIDGIDPAFAPGTGTVEIGGLTVPQALEIIRGCRGLDLVGGDLVEVSPPTIRRATRRFWQQTSCSKCCVCCRRLNIAFRQ